MIPPGHPLHKVFNRKTVKLSYSTMPNMLKKISVHSSKATAGAIAESADVTLVSDDNSAVSANNEEMQHLEAHPCADCEDNCEGFILETVDNGVTPASDDHSQLMTQAATALVVWDPALWMGTAEKRKIVKLCVHFCVCVSKSLRKWTQTDTKVTFHPPPTHQETFFGLK